MRCPGAKSFSTEPETQIIDLRNESIIVIIFLLIRNIHEMSVP
jgi:hypothetical protein